MAFESRQDNYGNVATDVEYDPKDATPTKAAEDYAWQDPTTWNKSRELHTEPTQVVNTSGHLKCHKRSLWLAGFYIPFLVLPWILTCIMTKRPPNLPSYYDQSGSYDANIWYLMVFWMGLVRVLNGIASLLTVPVISALLAHAAVVYSQRRNKMQQLNMRQVFALADQGWADLAVLKEAVFSGATRSTYLGFAFSTLLLGLVQVLIQQALVGSETIMIMTCADSPLLKYSYSESCNATKYKKTLSSLPETHDLARGLPGNGFARVVAFDPEPADLARMPQSIVVQEVIKRLATFNQRDAQQYLWPDPTTPAHQVNYEISPSSFELYYYPTGENRTFPRYYFTAVPNNTITGVLREHVLRLNSTVECKHIPQESYPSKCAGERPLVGTFDSPGNLTLRVCVPGNTRASPWTLSRNRQEVAEELFFQVDVKDLTAIPYGGSVGSFTVHCAAETTRGYFELGNIHNEFEPGPLLEQWPDHDVLRKDYNDYLIAPFYWTCGFGTTDRDVPSTIDDYSGSFENCPGPWDVDLDFYKPDEGMAPGPLTIAALAMFGNNSFFNVASTSSVESYATTLSQICQADNIAFARYMTDHTSYYNDYYDWRTTCSNLTDNTPISKNETSNLPSSEDLLYGMLYTWALVFNQTCRYGEPGCSDDNSIDYNSAPQALEVAMALANEAWLTQTATQTRSEKAREIYNGPGSPVIKPLMSEVSMIVISVLLVLQILSLLMLCAWIYSTPTWTDRLDSYAIAQLSRGLDDVIPEIGSANAESLKKLEDIDAVVGISSSQDEHQDDFQKVGSSGVQLARGALGIVDRVRLQLRRH